MSDSYTPADDAVLSAGQERTYRSGHTSATDAELAAEDARARQQMLGTARADLPATWISGDHDE